MSSRNNLLRVTSSANLQRTIIEDGKWKGRKGQWKLKWCVLTPTIHDSLLNPRTVCVCMCVCVCRVCTRSSDEIPVPGITSGENVSRYLRSSRKYLTVTPKNFLHRRGILDRVKRPTLLRGKTREVDSRIISRMHDICQILFKLRWKWFLKHDDVYK